MERYQIRYEGRVQGVGFRYFVYRTAGRFGLTGYVHNLCDGSVDVQVQGDEARIAAFLKVVKDGNGFIIITRSEIQKINPRPEEISFEIR
ncbi:MAG: acylphosphatase [Eubacteriales bacterium]